MLRRYLIFGPTYPIKEELAALGCYWNPNEKCWETNPMTNVEVAMLNKLIEGRDIELIKTEDIASPHDISAFFKELDQDIFSDD